MADDDDDFGFSDHDFDDLPANTLHELEETAIRATQRQPSALGSDYGLDDDGDEVVNLNDAAPRQHQRHRQRQQGHHAYDAMEIEHDDAYEGGGQELPRQSQVDIHQLLLRIKKVRYTAWLVTCPACECLCRINSSLNKKKSV